MAAETLHEAIHAVLADGPLRSGEIAAKINERRLWVRPSDGQAVGATQIGARIRRATYRDQFTIHPDRRISSNRTLRETDEDQDRLRAAIGQAVLSAASLEQTLRVVVLQRRAEHDGIDEQLVKFMLGLSDKPGGRLLEQLRSLGVDTDLVLRIRDVMGRRNRMIHHPAEHQPLVHGLTGRDTDLAISYVEIAADCDAIVAETQAAAIRGVLKVADAAPEQLDDWFYHRDLDAIEDDRLRATVATLRGAFT